MLTLMMENCKKSYKRYITCKWKDKDMFIAGIRRKASRGDDMELPMLDDIVISIKDDGDGRLCRWYSRQEKGTVTVDDIFKEACREKKHLMVGDILNNQEFDFNANFAIYECSKDVTWNDLDAPVYDTKLSDKDNKTPLELLYDREIEYMTIHDHTLIIEVGKED